MSLENLRKVINISEYDIRYRDFESDYIYLYNRCKGKNLLFHYTSLDAMRNIWNTQMLNLSSAFKSRQEMKEMLELGIPNVALEIVIAFFYIMKRYKTASFIKCSENPNLTEIISILMAGHLGPNEKKICIEIDQDKLDQSNILHQQKIKYNRKETTSDFLKGLNVCSMSDLIDHIKLEFENLLFTKNPCWACENEYRIIVDNTDYLSLHGAITGIYLASTDKKELESIRRIIGDKIEIKQICQGKYPSTFSCQNEEDAIYFDSLLLYSKLSQAQYNYCKYFDHIKKTNL